MSNTTPTSLNKKAYHNYTIIEKLVVGIVLNGCEIKSIRNNTINIRDSFARILNNEIWLIHCYIPPYEQGNRNNLPPNRDRKLLAHKREIIKLSDKVHQKGFTLVPTKLFLIKGKAKLELGLGKSKKLFDKRQVNKNRQIDRDIHRILKNRT